MAGNLFSNFGSFEVPQVPEGALTVVYGLSVDTVQVIGEATAANPEGLTPRDLAGKLASKFNMPALGLRVFVDGKEVPFEAPILAGARMLEFRQPSGEKGGTILLPLDDKDAVLITVVRRDKVQYVRFREEPKGRVSRTLLDRIDLGELEVLSVARDFATVGLRTPEVRAQRHQLRLEYQIRRHAGGEIPGAAAGVEVVHVDDLTEGRSPVALILNGKEVYRFSALSAGDNLAVVLLGEDRQADCTALARRAAQVAELGWTRLRILGAKRGVKVAGRGRTSAAIAADILRVEYPEILRDAEDEFVMTWLYPES